MILHHGWRSSASRRVRLCLEEKGLAYESHVVDMASMEHPIFSLATKTDTRVLRYEHRNVTVEIAPSVKGLATIYDKDILIYCISQLMAKKNAGEPLAQTRDGSR